jgi:HEPN domain-containing protein/predicted nucleotidyltransferase
MQSSLNHLPPGKQAEIISISEVIKQIASPEMIILFGSYAKGTWVEDNYTEQGIRYNYTSDYDFLVVTRNRLEKDYILADRIVNSTKHITRVAVNPIIHEIDYINEGLATGQYFFSDIINEGVPLFDSGKVKFDNPRQLTLKETKELQQQYFSQWYKKASGLLTVVSFSVEVDHNIAAFLLHQAVEAFYNTVLLVFTGYKPKTHSLEKLRQYTKPLSQELYAIFPAGNSSHETHLFNLLKSGYIDARYKHDYSITSRELTELITRVQKMQEVVCNICKQKIGTTI